MNVPNNINFEDLMNNIEKIESGNFGGDSIFWTPKEDQTRIRIIQPNPAFPNNLFALPCGTHEWGGKHYECPKQVFAFDSGSDSSCPFCEAWGEVYNNAKREGRNSKELTNNEKALASSLRLRRRFVSPIIVRGEEDLGVRWYNYGKKVYDKIIYWLKTGRYGNIFDWVNGRDIVLVRSKQGEYYNYDNSELYDSPSPAGTNAQIETWFYNMMNIQKWLRDRVKNYDELLGIMKENLNTNNVISEAVNSANVISNVSTPQPSYDISQIISNMDITNMNALAEFTKWQTTTPNDISALFEIVKKYPKGGFAPVSPNNSVQTNSVNQGTHYVEPVSNVVTNDNQQNIDFPQVENSEDSDTFDSTDDILRKIQEETNN